MRVITDICRCIPNVCMWTSILRNKICNLWVGIEVKWGGSKDKSPRERTANPMLFQFRFKLFIFLLFVHFKNYVYTPRHAYTLTSSVFCSVFFFSGSLQMYIYIFIFRHWHWRTKPKWTEKWHLVQVWILSTFWMDHISLESKN